MQLLEQVGIQALYVWWLRFTTTVTQLWRLLLLRRVGRNSVDCVEAELNASLQWIVGKGRGLREAVGGAWLFSHPFGLQRRSWMSRDPAVRMIDRSCRPEVSFCDWCFIRDPRPSWTLKLRVISCFLSLGECRVHVCLGIQAFPPRSAHAMMFPLAHKTEEQPFTDSAEEELMES